jgi:hypothetical protein
MARTQISVDQINPQQLEEFVRKIVREELDNRDQDKPEK